MEEKKKRAESHRSAALPWEAGGEDEIDDSLGISQ